MPSRHTSSRHTSFPIAALIGAVLAAAIYPALARATPPATMLTGRVSVVDGDTLRMGDARVRLYGIDAPERAQHCDDGAGVAMPCGMMATARLADMVDGRIVGCEPRNTDRYGRLVAICWAGGRNINRAMVQTGWAEAYRAYAIDYVPDERMARRRQRGVWAMAYTPAAAYRAARRHRR
ncbi:MAG: thermonuclease family protein [Sphingopyxis sp.]